MEGYFDERYDGVSKARLKLIRKHHSAAYGRLAVQHEFKCVHCQRSVSTDPRLAGVNNRNHCPYCLWSRHLDLFSAGDRLSACKQPMQAVGLTVKQTHKKYARREQGELMLVHLCSGCGKVSLNRIAADDLTHQIYAAFEHAVALTDQQRTLLEAAGIQPLQPADRRLVAAQLGAPDTSWPY